MLLRFLICAVILIPLLANAGEDKDKCIIRGACGPNPDGSRDPLLFQTNCLNCKLEKPEDPQGLSEESIEKLYRTCPHLREQLGPWSNKSSDTESLTSAKYELSPKVCCTRRQIDTMTSSFGQAEDLLARCPVCYANWRKNFCASTCLPGNVQFLQIARDEQNSGEELLHIGEPAPCGGDEPWNGSNEYKDVDPGDLFDYFSTSFHITHNF